MPVNRRAFLFAGIAGVAALSTEGLRAIARTLSTTQAAPPTAAATAATAVTSAAASPYGACVRAQVFEVIVRQARVGAPWRIICDGPMMVNGITEEEVLAEVERRGGPVHKTEHRDTGLCDCANCIDAVIKRMEETHAKHTTHDDNCSYCMSKLRHKVTAEHTSHRKFVHGCVRCIMAQYPPTRAS